MFIAREHEEKTEKNENTDFVLCQNEIELDLDLRLGIAKRRRLENAIWDDSSRIENHMIHSILLFMQSNKFMNWIIKHI